MDAPLPVVVYLPSDAHGVRLEWCLYLFLSCIIIVTVRINIPLLCQSRSQPLSSYAGHPASSCARSAFEHKNRVPTASQIEWSSRHAVSDCISHWALFARLLIRKTFHGSQGNLARNFWHRHKHIRSLVQTCGKRVHGNLAQQHLVLQSNILKATPSSSRLS
jgi:hypothetical protein